MSIYNSNVKSWVISPVFHRSGLRSEFRLPESSKFLSSMRLLNVGVISAGNEGVRYNYLAGSAGCIRNIYLMDGKTVIDQVLNFQALEAFKRYNKTNAINCDYGKVLHNHGQGYVYANQQEVDLVTYAKIREYNPTAANIPTPDENNTPKAFISLQEVFPVLKSMLYLDTTLFSKLTVIVEYTATNAMVYDANIKPTGNSQPLLVADEILDASKLPKFTGVQWNTMELESVQMTEGLNNSTQVVNRKLMGFNEKTLNRLLVQKALLTPGADSPLYGNLGSEAMVDETFQVVVNGSNLLADQGITTPSMALAMLTDTFGNCNTAHMSNDVGCYGAGITVDGVYNRIGHLSYFGVVVSEKIKNLQIAYSRKCRVDGDDSYKVPLVLNFFGEVTKQIVLTKDGYKVLYA